uniref:Uncharacterized protein n=1 Tax=Glossina pallidipes TaxID=7398 RepID=A0A1A9ZUG8_GLOPL
MLSIVVLAGVITRPKVGYFEKFAITEPTAYVLLVGWLVGWLVDWLLGCLCLLYAQSLKVHHITSPSSEFEKSNSNFCLSCLQVVVVVAATGIRMHKHTYTVPALQSLHCSMHVEYYGNI